MIVSLAILVLFNLFTVVEGKRCYMLTEFTVFDPNDTNAEITCRTCPKCPVGQGLPIQCGFKVPIGISTDCIPCPNNTYSITNDSSACKFCHECDGKKVLKECTPTQNRHCGTTCKEPNYYLNSDTDECKECYFCCEDVSDVERLQQCKDIGMPSDKQCKKTPKNEQCRLASLKKTTTAPPTVTPGRVTVNNSKVNNNHSSELERPSKPPPPPIYDSGNNNENTPVPEGQEYTGFYIVGGLLAVLVGGIFVTVMVAKVRNNRSLSRDGNRADGEQGVEQELDVLVQGPPERAANTSNGNCVIERDALENEIAEGVMLDDFPYYGQDFVLKLDITTPGVKNWRHVACKFNVENLHFQMLEQRGNGNPPRSPTRDLMEKLGTQNVSLKTFVDVLQNLDRNDVANGIINWYNKNKRTKISAIRD